MQLQGPAKGLQIAPGTTCEQRRHRSSRKEQRLPVTVAGGGGGGGVIAAAGIVLKRCHSKVGSFTIATFGCCKLNSCGNRSCCTVGGFRTLGPWHAECKDVLHVSSTLRGASQRLMSESTPSCPLLYMRFLSLRFQVCIF